MSQPLEPLRFPLRGQRLIEASAGTGKTYTIAGLYLRLLLGHGPADSAFPRPLPVDQILVVTFTEAATEELRDRIRQRIHAARLAFIRGQSEDPLLARLLEETTDHPLLVRLLLVAEQQMDQAAIFTIHGFCQRMLRQNAFESGMLFDTEFAADESRLRFEAAADFWRSRFYPLAPALAAQVQAEWGDPAALLRAITPYLNYPELQLTPAPQETSLAQRHQRNLERIEAVKQAWRQGGDLAGLIAGSGVNKRSYSSANLPKWLATIDAWAAAPTDDYTLPEPLSRFAQSILLEKTTKGEPPRHGVFERIDALLAEPPGIKDWLLATALTEIRQRLEQAKARARQQTFDDLLSGLDRALGGQFGQALAERVRSLFPVALIDEFQDTDPQQYRIFHRIYASGEDVASGLFMIGDPKQAIYGFRGADIFTYIQARRQVTDHYTLGTNWRSHQAMVAAVNGLFARAERTIDSGAFIYNRDIHFQPVAAKGKGDALTVDGAPQPALTLWHYQAESAAVVGKGEYQAVMAQRTATEINRLLSGADAGRVRLGERPLEAADIVVLVRTGREGEAIRAALAQQGIASVYLSNRDSVFVTQEAQDLQRLLQACLTPQDEPALRAALATPLLGLNADELDRLNREEASWEQVLTEFRGYRTLWRQRGVLPMLRRLLFQRQLPARLLAGTTGERQLTDLLHLGELLQQASLELDGQHSLLRWLGEQIAAPNGQAEEQQLRLESDRNLVQIVTIHKSKGLEYQLVFLPFVCSARRERTGLYHQDGKVVLDLLASEAACEAADRERLAEDLRLLYVALTRAVYASWLGVAPLRSGGGKGSRTDLHHSAIGYLLQEGQEGDGALLEQSLAALAAEHDGIVVRPIRPESQPPYRAAPPAEVALTARRCAGVPERNWWLTSYSGLTRQHAAGPAGLEWAGLDLEVVADAAGPGRDGESIFDFPRGTRAGTFLHGLFEVLDFPAAGGPSLRDLVARQLQLAGFEAHWQPALCTLVGNVLDSELAPGLRLRDIGEEDKLVEMEFVMPLAALESGALSDLLGRFDPLSAKAPALAFDTVQGMLKGFIDLVFVHQGRFYVLDYKSNHLGDQPADYSREAMTAAMIAHRYDLQYQLYTLALHRFLRQRLPDYQYERHVGGVFYLFLRGMDAREGQGNGIFTTRPDKRLIEALDRLFEGEESGC